jgi:hypothetical protein
VIVMRGTEIRQQLRNQSLETLQVGSINTVGDRIFPDDMAILDMEALQQIVSAWRATHSPNYGQILPNTGAIAEGIADGGGLEPGNNEVIDVVAISLANAGGAPVEVSVRIGDLPLIALAVAPTGATSSELGAIFPLTLSKGLALKFVVTSGTASDFSAKVAYAYRSF